MNENRPADSGQLSNNGIDVSDIMENGVGLRIPHEWGFRSWPAAVEYIRTDLLTTTTVQEAEAFLDGLVESRGAKRAHTLRLSPDVVADPAGYLLKILEVIEADVLFVPDIRHLGGDVDWLRNWCNVVAGDHLFPYSGASRPAARREV